ncbi:hypothetical protein NQ315_000141 [Exocentrus adspersus]|uniref:dolichyl-P-Glc:Man9GlcNAc2-PP-dolichol alpha-1,3-glucosyltransferase n=1 Tax=Exocentrus adspersus TaxID=1586481 RepID=A0AAV8VR88_9CUCU|nr:hypothetical protein NQ315_000141 [Exocentrus adspersus]
MECKISCESWLVIFGTLLAVLLRCCTSLHPYSGEATPPMYGDYEAQRHWMEVTVNLPLKEWYRNGTHNDLNYWGLDYPPLTAYHMYLCGRVAEWLNTNYTKLHDSRGYESEAHKVFMRATVLLGDVLLYIPALVLYYHACLKLTKTLDSDIKKRKKERVSRTLNEIKPMSASLSTILALLYPGIILIDHGHFQYNCISLALMVLATTCLLHERDLLASACFCLSLNYKQMELYHALPFFLYLLSTCVPKPGQSTYWGVLRLVKISVTVVTMFLLIWLPFLTDLNVALEVVQRQFPVARGVFEDKVANVWCALNVLFKFKTRFDNYQMMRLCLFATLLAVFPSSVDLFLRPNSRKFVLALVNSSLAFFLFSFQVHEKSILLVAVPVLMYFPYAPFVCFWFLCLSGFSMLPLLVKDGLVMAFVALTVFYVVSFRVCIEHAYRTSLNTQNGLVEYYKSLLHTLLDIEYKKVIGLGVVKAVHRQVVKNTEALRTLIFHFGMLVSLFGCLVLFLASLVFKAPSRYPDLFPLLISVYSCIHFLGFFVYFNVKQLRIPQQFEDEVVDESDGCGGKFSCVIVSDKNKSFTLQTREFGATGGAEEHPRLLAEDVHLGAVGRAAKVKKMSGDANALPSNIKPTGLSVVVSTPGKVILYGEHSVVYGKLALSASLGLRSRVKLFEISAPNLVVIQAPALHFTSTYDLQKLKEHLLAPLPLTHLASEYNWEHPESLHHDAVVDLADGFVSFTTGSASMNAKQKMGLTALFYLVSGIMGSVNVELNSFLLCTESELSIGAGTGSSASFLVGVAALLVQYVKLRSGGLGNVSKEGYKPYVWDGSTPEQGFSRRELDMICRWGYCAERIMHGAPSGVDNTICTYGGVVEFRKGLVPKLLPVSRPIRILLVDTKVQRDTKKLVWHVAALHKQYPDLTSNILNAMEDVAFIALQHLTVLCSAPEQAEANYEELGRLASMNHNLLSALGVSHLKLDEVVHVLTEHGLHGKLTGAGGGGYAFCWVPPGFDEAALVDVMGALAARGVCGAVDGIGRERGDD